MEKIDFLRFTSARDLRYRLVCSILSGKPIKISRIRNDNISNPGITDTYEANLLKLLDLITNGTQIEINPTGTSLTFIPGILLGGKHEDTFYTDTSRGIGYYLEPLFLLAPFCKNKLEITLAGRTNGLGSTTNPDTKETTSSFSDPAADIFRTSGIAAIRKFLLIDDDLKLEIIKRSIGAEADKGIVKFSCPNPKKLKTVHENFIGKLGRIRGLAYSCKVPPQLATRVGKIVRSNFSEYLKDVFIYNESNKCDKASKGYGLVLVGETMNGQGETVSTFAVEKSCSQSRNEDGSISTQYSPEELGENLVTEFCDEISRIGVVDSYFQPLACLYMMLTEQDVSSLMLGPLTDQCITMLRLIRQFFNVTFKVEEEEDDDEDDEEDEAGLKNTNAVDAGGDAGDENENPFSDDDEMSDAESDESGHDFDLPQKVSISCVGVGYSNTVRRMR